jgi:prolyl 4-hydroxylase
MEISNNQIHSMEKTFFKNSDELPRLTTLGFEVKRVPVEIFNIIKDAYNSLKDSARDENAGLGFIKNASGSIATEIMSLDQFPEIRESILQGLLSEHEAWADVDLSPIACYGIRSYKNGSTLKMHKDKVETHHISCIIIVDEDGEKWPLDIKDHTGKLHHVYAKPGDMIMYESAVCEHGRTTPYPGNFFRNMFVHYSFKNLIYKPE